MKSKVWGRKKGKTVTVTTTVYHHMNLPPPPNLFAVGGFIEGTNLVCLGDMVWIQGRERGSR